MKTRLLLLALLALLLLSGCAHRIMLSARTPSLHDKETSVIDVDLLDGGVTYNMQTRATVTSDSDKATFALRTTPLPGGAPADTPRSHTLAVNAAQNSETIVVAGPVDQNTKVRISGEWRAPMDTVESSIVLTIKPPVVQSPGIASGNYIEVAPSVDTPAWTFIYDIQAKNAGGTWDIADCNLQFNVPVKLRVVEAISGTIGSMSVTATELPGGTWAITSSVAFISLKVEVKAADAHPGGTTTILCREQTTSGYTNYSATVTGPK